MINPNKCQVCYPIVAKVFEVKFEGEKDVKKCVLRGWQECSEPATEHYTEYLDVSRPGTALEFHRCTNHTNEAKELHDVLEKSKRDQSSR